MHVELKPLHLFKRANVRIAFTFAAGVQRRRRQDSTTVSLLPVPAEAAKALSVSV